MIEKISADLYTANKKAAMSIGLIKQPGFSNSRLTKFRAKKAEFWYYVIVVVFPNVRTLRVVGWGGGSGRCGGGGSERRYGDRND